jgi:O-antigen ligase
MTALSAIVVPPFDVASALAFVLLFAVTALAVWKRPIVGVMLLLVFDPFDFAHRLWGTNVTTTKIVVLGALAGLAARRAPLGVFARAAPRHVLLAAGAIVVATVATVSSATYLDAVARETLKAVEYALLFAVTAVAYDAEPNEDAAAGALLFSAIAVSAAAIAARHAGASSFTTIGGTLVTRLSGPLEGPNQLAGFYDVLLPVLLAFACARRNVALGAGAALCLACDLVTHSRAGLAGAFAGSAVVFVRFAATTRAGTLRAAGALVAAAAATAIAFANVDPRTLDGDVDLGSGLGTRADLWPAALAFFFAHPILGIGAGNFELALPRLGLIDIHTHANSLYLQSLAEGGLVLFAATLAALVVALLTFGFARTREPLVIGVAGSTVALALHQMFDDLSFYPKVGGAYWIVLGIAAAVLARTQSVAAPTIRARERRLLWGASVVVCVAAIVAWHEPKTVADATTGARLTIVAGRAIPSGVVATARELRSPEFGGLYPNDATDTFCCWLAPHARIETLVPPGASAVVVALLVPDVAFFSQGGQRVTLAAGSQRRDVDFARPGVQHVTIALEPQTISTKLRVDITSRRTLVPVREHINADTRELGVVLRGIGFRMQAW